MYISQSNTKMNGGKRRCAKIASFSLPPGETCAKHCRQCYGNRMMKLYPHFAKTVQKNLQELQKQFWQHPTTMEAEINLWLQAHPQVELFRIHVTGDFAVKVQNPGVYGCLEYFEMWRRIAKANPKVRFLAFTKVVEVYLTALMHDTPNLTVRFSYLTPNPPKDYKLLARVWELSYERNGERFCPADFKPYRNFTRETRDKGDHGQGCLSCQKCWDKTVRCVVFKLK